MSWVCSLGASSLLASYNALGFWYLVSSTSSSRSQQTWSCVLAGDVGEHWFPVQNSHTSFTKDRTFLMPARDARHMQHVWLSREHENKNSFLNLWFNNPPVILLFIFNIILLSNNYFLFTILIRLKDRLSVDHVRDLITLL